MEKETAGRVHKTSQTSSLQDVHIYPNHNHDDFTKQSGEIDVEKTAGGTVTSVPVKEQAEDVNIVDWDGPDDPEMALNWPARKKWINIMLLATLTLLTPFASSMFAPSVDMVMDEFHETNIDLASFVVSVYLLGYAFGPLVIAPMSELYGRLPLYRGSTVLFILFNVACAKSTSFSMLIVFRFLTGLAGSCPLTLGPGSIADCFRQEERGRIMAVWTLPVTFGPTIGPIAGGYLSESLGWRWDFWFLIIVTGAMFLLSLFVQRETYPPKLLEQRTQRLRKSTGNPNLRSALQSTRPPLELFWTSIARPTKMLIFSPVILFLSICTALVYGYLYLLFTTMTEVFEGQYHISTSNVGLTYLGLGTGQIIGVTIFGIVSDKILQKMASKNGGELKPEYRLPPLLVGSGFIGSGLLWYGWTAQAGVHWIVPILGMGVIGLGVITSFMPVTAYLVDAFTVYAASATAANTVLRSLGAALLPLCGRRMYDALGLGWGNTLLALVSFGSMPFIWGFIKYGERVRRNPRFQVEL